MPGSARATAASYCGSADRQLAGVPLHASWLERCSERQSGIDVTVLPGNGVSRRTRTLVLASLHCCRYDSYPARTAGQVSAQLSPRARTDCRSEVTTRSKAEPLVRSITHWP